jgi:hypothetical protein
MTVPAWATITNRPGIDNNIQLNLAGVHVPALAIFTRLQSRTSKQLNLRVCKTTLPVGKSPWKTT